MAWLSHIGFIMRPIDTWPGELTKDRLRSPFGGWGDTAALMDRELRHLGADSYRSMLVATDQIRTDGSGFLKGATVAHQGVVLTFGSRFGPLKYACDRFDDMGSNIRAIALGLEALRRVERYGISRRGEQYQGYRQLAAAVVEMTPEIARNTIAKFSGIPAASLHDPDVLTAAWRLAAKRTHPDAGGNVEDAKAVNEAREFLKVTNGQ